MPTRAIAAVAFAIGVAAAIGADARASLAPVAPPRLVTATVGKAFTFKFDKAAVLGPAENGLRNDRGTITGTPALPMVMFAAKGADTTWIVVFAAGLRRPVLPAALHGYVGGSIAIPSRLLNGNVRTRPGVAEIDSAAANPTTDAGATLGRVLFYDPRLSVEDRIACASCHHQSLGFSDSARFSEGVGGTTRRHSMSLANIRFSGTLGVFWDQRAKSLEEQVLKPIQDSIEMGLTLRDLMKKLQATDYYPDLYKAAFGTPDISVERTARALAQFLRALVSGKSLFDSTIAVGDRNAVPADVAEGQRVFLRNCSICHGGNSQIIPAAINSGLDSVPQDLGAGGARFRPPSLRNVAIRPPYMHDGRFKSLDEVIDFYTSKVNRTPALDVRLSMGPGVNVTPAEREALLAFLRSLTDSTFLTAKEFSDPFKR